MAPEVSMCLAVPLEIIRVLEDDRAIVREGRGELEVDVSLLEKPTPGDYILVHAGFAIQRIDFDEATKTLEMLDQLGDAAR
jgi:hydrogenase assembly chaperone HypC/HupF